jgi:hypothetical protein
MRDSSEHRRIAAYAFGSTFVAFLMAVFFIGDPGTPVWKQQIVAFLGALLVALTTVFLVGSTKIEGDFGKGIRVRTTGGVGVFLAVFVLWILAIERTSVGLDSESANFAPVAVVGPKLVRSGRGLVQLDGNGSYDPDGDRLAFTWTLATPRGSKATISDLRGVRPTYFLDVPGLYTVTLVVNDGSLDSEPVESTAWWPKPPAPTARARPDSKSLASH